MHARSVYDIVLCVYERFRVDGLKRYVNDDRFRVDGDKNMRLLAFAFTIVSVWTGPKSRISPRFCFQIPNPQLQIREIPNPDKIIEGPLFTIVCQVSLACQSA